MDKSAIDSVAMTQRTIRVVLPAKVAFDLKAMHDTLAQLAERLGCKPCLSGADCVFSLERELIVDPAGQLRGLHERATGG